MNLDSRELEAQLLESGTGTRQFIHSREVAALLESFGYGDRSVKEAGFPNIFSFAENLLGRLQPGSEMESDQEIARKRTTSREELRCAVRKFSLSLSYVVPWMALLVLEYFRPNALDVPPELGGALGLALIASLITAGGFIQMISRSGSFYYGLEEPGLARRICMSLVNVGLTSGLLLGVLGMVLGAYFQVFAGSYLLLAAMTYVALSLLWMFCAVLSVQEIGWCVPVVFLVSALMSALIKTIAGASNAIVLTLWPVTAGVCALGWVLWGFRHAQKKFKRSQTKARPRVGVFSISLAPFYLYGTLYFSFLFADRLVAGSVVPWTSGLSFGIDPAYKRGMDLVLLGFLMTAALVEYLGDSFVRFWQRRALETPQARADQLATGLSRLHTKMTLLISIAFILLSLSAWSLLAFVNGAAPPARMLYTAILGGTGYLLLSLALLEIVILSSCNATSLALASIGPGLAVNLLVGYGLSHLWGVQYAAAGLLAGSTVVLWRCHAAVRHVLRYPDYYYSIS